MQFILYRTLFLSDIFNKNHKPQKQSEAYVDNLYRQIGKLKVENDFLAKKLSL